MHNYAVLARGPYRPDQLLISYAPGARRTARPGDQADAGAAWQNALDQARQIGIPLYDGLLYRLMSFEQRPGQLGLQLGDTSYKEYVATRAPAFVRGRSEDELAQPLAVCVAVVTRDERILVERRQRSEVGTGRYHVIGGFFERDKDVGPEGPSPFLAMAREVREETELEIDPREFLVLGLAYDRLLPHPELCLTVSTPMSFAEVARHVPRDGEVVHLESVGADAASLSAFLLANRNDLTPSGEACLTMYGVWRYGDGWNAELPRRD